MELFPKERIECHLIMEEGSVPCERPGTCTLHAIYNQLLQFYYSSISLSIQIWLNLIIHTAISAPRKYGMISPLKRLKTQMIQEIRMM